MFSFLFRRRGGAGSLCAVGAHKGLERSPGIGIAGSGDPASPGDPGYAVGAVRGKDAWWGPASPGGLQEEE